MSEHRDSGFALLLVDIDRFEEINATYGHLFGDEVLQLLAHALRAGTREGDLRARVGGDEFLVILRDKSETEVALLVGEIQKNCAAANRISDKDYTLSFSIGYTIADPAPRRGSNSVVSTFWSG